MLAHEEESTKEMEKEMTITGGLTHQHWSTTDLPASDNLQ